MTDKEIIIDGINVAGCEYLHEYDNIGCDIDECYCNGCDCYFKQLARKEQECEKLREANDEKNEFLQKLGISATGEFHRIKHYIDKLYQEREELKNEINRLNSFTDMEKELWIITEKQKQKINELKNNLAIANSNHEAAEEELDRYSQALEKIRKLAIKSNLPPCLNVDYNCDICQDEITNKGQNCMLRGLNKILQIINEVKE